MVIIHQKEKSNRLTKNKTKTKKYQKQNIANIQKITSYTKTLHSVS
jgi:hypothetical protein